MDASKKSTVAVPSANKEYLDQRVRGHDFLAYFRSHMMTICLVFWFLTISVTVGATAIYLIKKLEMDSKSHQPEVSTDKNDGEIRDGDDKESKDYSEIDIVDFLIDTFYPGAEEKSVVRADEASVNATSSNFTVPDSEEIGENVQNDEY
ncbi:hypothetical protein GE061_001937 [Apolygus lucorum]|uniref:Uncharacterized protein n=1 Tax=Apolygus lucorum TaxID=248454 RepID=A0A6A4JK36_APOLU|nr:hypothetical protein GE061_001937 [Apolygus lucorum]